MAVEGLTLTPPTGSAIDLNGTKWGLEALAIGQPARREDLISSLDADGGLPARVSPRDVREVTATVRLLDAANMNAALNSIADLERVLESAERLAASNPTNPVLDLVRLVYTPAGSTYSYSLILLAAEVTEIPREMTGDGLGFFIARPVVSIRAICDPFAYGTTGSSPFTTTYLDKTTTAAYGVSETVAGGVGDVSPWLRLKVKDVDSKVRNRVIAGVRVGEAKVTPVIAAADLTAVAGTIASGTVTTSSTDYVVSASIPRQTRTGSFRAYLAEASSATDGSVRLVSSEAGGSKRVGPSVSLSAAGRIDAYLGEVVVDSSWDGWIETNGSVTYKALVLIPTDSFIEIQGAAGGEQMTGAATVVDELATTSSELNARSLTKPSGQSWSASGVTGWPVSTANGARRTATSSTAVIAQAGTTDFIDLDLRWSSKTTRAFDGSTNLGTLGLQTGAVARYVNATNYVWIGFVNEGTGYHLNARPNIVRRLGSDIQTIWQGDIVPLALAGLQYGWIFQVTSDGRWYAELRNDYEETLQSAYGQDANLVQGETLGNTSAAKVGLIDTYLLATPAMTRDLYNFRASPLVGVTPPPVPSGATLTLSGPKMTNSDGAEYPYIGSSGIEIRPGVDNNLTVAARRSSGYLSSTGATTDPLDLDIDGYPRFISVPHT